MPALTVTVLEGGGRSRTPLEDISDEVIETVEECYANTLQSGDAVGPRYETPSLGSKDDAEEWLRDARSYGWHRGQGENAKGRVVVAGNSTKAGNVRFRVYTYVADDSE